MMRSFNLERLHNAVLSLGFAQAAYDLCHEFVQEREQFGRPVVIPGGTVADRGCAWTFKPLDTLVYTAAELELIGSIVRLFLSTLAWPSSIPMRWQYV